MKKTLLITALFLGMMSLKAQEAHFGIRAAGSFTKYKASGNGASGYNDFSKGKMNFEIGAVGEFLLNDQFAIAPELNYAGSGDKLELIDGDLKDVKILSTAYIQIPVMVKYYLNDNLSLNFGPQIGMLMSAQGTSKITIDGDTETVTENIKNEYNSNEFGFNLGGSFKMDNGLFIDVRYFMGMSNLDKYSHDSSLKSSGIKFGVGYYFN